MPTTLLDPRNDLVFKKQFANAPDLLADLINAVRSDEDPIEVIEVLNPQIHPEDITGKYIVLDVLVSDAYGNLFNIEMQVRASNCWVERSLYYLASAYTSQLKRGGEYATLKPVIGINLLDFDLFEGDEAHWHFRLCHRRQHKQPALQSSNTHDIVPLCQRMAAQTPTTRRLPMPATLLDPKNDLVFKKLFAATPDLLADLINAIRSDHPPSTSPKSSTPTSIRKPSLAIALNLTAKRAIFAANPTITPPAATTQLATINLPG